jgi:hypothetical protein
MGYGENAVAALVVVALLLILLACYLGVKAVLLVINGFIRAPAHSKCRKWLWASLFGWLISWVVAALATNAAGPELTIDQLAQTVVMVASAVGLVCLVVLLIAAKVAVVLNDELYQGSRNVGAFIGDVVHPGSWWQVAS